MNYYRKTTYEQPAIEITYIEVEQGFAGSSNNINGLAKDDELSLCEEDW